MAKITTENLIWKFFEKWKQRRLNKLAKKTLKDNPELEKSLKQLDAIWQKTIDNIDNREK